MKKIFTLLLCLAISISSFGQWSPTKIQEKNLSAENKIEKFYTLDIDKIRTSLEAAQETGKNAKPVIINLPTLDGKIEKFAVYSFPVVVKSLADQYHLGSYVGVGVDDPSKYVRFSVAPNDFQSMIIKNGKYEFIESQNADKSVYGVHAKTVNTGKKPFLCSTAEKPISKQQMDELFKNGSSFANQPTNFSRSSDKKYRTMRLVISTTGEYTAFFGGVAGALTQINATMTRVNGVFENDFSIHLILQNYPNLIYTDANTDPYSPASSGAKGAWNEELMNTLHTNPGDAAFDIGHLFGATGGGGNAGCIGCVCNNTLATGGEANDSYKGSGYTSPADGKPYGDNFDIDYVAHEIGHQFGGNHTFSFALEGTGVNIEPGSGSTIMGYAGITNEAGQPKTDVQAHSDPYFSVASLIQINDNMQTRSCPDITSIPNNPPVIAALTNYTIPKGTAFILTASATDPENDPLTYCWEEVDDASTTTNEDNLGLTSSGPSFRSLSPTTSPTRYFPKLSSVIAGALDNSLKTWESVSMVARTTNFRVTVRDNSTSSPGYQQTQNASQQIVVGNDGPFKISSTKIYNNSAESFTWDTVNTQNAPYNVSNVKIDYTKDNGANWVVVSASTPNDGVENLNFAPLATGDAIIVRVSAVGNVFYAVKPLVVGKVVLCDGSAPINLIAGDITSTAVRLSWDPVANANYVLQYRKIGATNWTVVNTPNNFLQLTNLDDNTQFEAQVAAVCTGTTGSFSPSTNFSTANLAYCANSSTTGQYEYISKVEILPTSGTSFVNTSDSSNYTSYVADASKVINLTAGTTGNILNVTKKWSQTPFKESVHAWIDFNRDGIFDASEKIMTSPYDKTEIASSTFSVPAAAYAGAKTVGMRIILTDKGTQNNACDSFSYGEVEDYAVKIASSLAVDDSAQKNTFQVYPNPATDVLNITKANKNTTFSIYNTAGQIVSKGKVLNNKVKVSQLLKGVYIITINNGSESANVKFIKK